MAEVGIIRLKVDLHCSSCSKKIKRLLCELKECERIQSIKYDYKNNTITLSGPFNTDFLIRKLRCKAGRVIKDIVDEKKEMEEEKKKKEEEEKKKKKEDEEKKKKKEEEDEEKKKKEDEEKKKKKEDEEKKKKKEEEEKKKVVVVVPYSPWHAWPVCCGRPCPCYDHRAGCSRCCSCGKVCNQPPAPVPAAPACSPPRSGCCWRPCPCYDHRAGCCRCCSCGRVSCNEPPAPAPAPPPSMCTSAGAGYKITYEDAADNCIIM